MNPAQLQDWDNKKNALERPISQLIAVPGKDTSLTGRADDMLASYGLGHPLSRIAGQFSAPAMPKGPVSQPEAPSVALGYANRSKLVR